jgi:diguanylate cyclase (GGDEF)-like protein/PAS domain S-box-containing protein
MINPENSSATLRAKYDGLTASQLHRRNIVALTLIALLTIFSQVVVQFLIADQEHDSRIVNIAGRQRMLSQKITKISFYISDSDNAETVEQYRNQLSEALALWQRTHQGLQKGDREMGLPGNNSAAIKTLFQKIEPSHQAIVAASDLIISSPDDTIALKIAAKSIQKYEPDFLDGMDAIVFRYDKEAKDKVEIARWLELGLMTITLIVLVLGALLIFAPATRRLRRDMQELADSEQDLERLFEASPTAMMMVDLDDLSIIRANQKALELTKLAHDHLLHKSLANLLHSDYDANRTFMEKLRGDKALNEFEVVLLDTNKDVIESLVSSRIIGFAGRSVYVLGFTNINELKKTQQSLEYFATYDELTGLVNRRTGLMFLEKSMARSWRESSPLSIIFADLDGLKMANDTFGHAEGDRLIRAAANIMTGLIRSSDFAVRMGGDEFLIILPNCPPINAQRVVENLENLLSAIKNDNTNHSVYSISCGVATYVADRHTSPDELIAEADQEMYRAKNARKSGED